MALTKAIGNRFPFHTVSVTITRNLKGIARSGTDRAPLEGGHHRDAGTGDPVVWAGSAYGLVDSFPVFSTMSWLSTPNDPGTSRAFMPATVLSLSLSTTPSSVIFPFLTMMWIG